MLLPSFIQLVTESNFPVNDFKVKNVAKESPVDEWTNNFVERKIVPDNYNQIKVFLERNNLSVHMLLSCAFKNNPDPRRVITTNKL